jgi:hypothetical protein
MMPQKKNNFFLKSTLSLLSSILLPITFMSQAYADRIDNPIVNPIDPTQVIEPQDNEPTENSTPPIPPASTPKPAEKPVAEPPAAEEPTQIPALSNLAQPYHFSASHQKNKHVPQQALPAVLPTYDFEIDLGPGDDLLLDSSTGYRLAAISGSMLFGR